MFTITMKLLTRSIYIDSEYTQVIIVGGGVSGLVAAKVSSNKINYVLIEAQNYLGVRVQTIDAASNLFIDMGAQFVIGVKSELYKFYK
ncbi:hypothetical protein I4U23_016552 [Adineta vaga]|nr:hypothetical protein I4U23_016552 [Adineta vaga]